jgi:hypothetical protein
MKVMAKQSQLDKFKQAARELKTDDDEKRFNERLGKIAKQKPADPPKKSKKEGLGEFEGVRREVAFKFLCPVEPATPTLLSAKLLGKSSYGHFGLNDFSFTTSPILNS